MKDVIKKTFEYYFPKETENVLDLVILKLSRAFPDLNYSVFRAGAGSFLTIHLD